MQHAAPTSLTRRNKLLLGGALVGLIAAIAVTTLTIVSYIGKLLIRSFNHSKERVAFVMADDAAKAGRLQPAEVIEYIKRAQIAFPHDPQDMQGSGVLVAKWVDPYLTQWPTATIEEISRDVANDAEMQKGFQQKLQQLHSNNR